MSRTRYTPGSSAPPHLPSSDRRAALRAKTGSTGGHCHLRRRDGGRRLRERASCWAACTTGSRCSPTISGPRAGSTPSTSSTPTTPAAARLRDVYVVEKIGTKEGWAIPPPTRSGSRASTRRFRTSWSAARQDAALRRTPRSRATRWPRFMQAISPQSAGARRSPSPLSVGKASSRTLGERARLVPRLVIEVVAQVGPMVTNQCGDTAYHATGSARRRPLEKTNHECQLHQLHRVRVRLRRCAARHAESESVPTQGGSGMKRTRIRSARYALMVLFGLVLLTALPGLSVAQPVDVPPTWGGNFWDRPRLTGSWGGLRDELGKKGVVIDGDILLSPQGVMSGGKDTGWDFWGNADYTLNIDTGKLGLWPGGFFKFYGDSSFGDSVQPRTSAHRAGEHVADTAQGRPTTRLRAHERDVHAVSQPQVRSARGQGLHARRLQGRVQRRPPHPVHEHGADVSDGGRPHCDIGVRRGSRRPAVGGRHPLGHGARRRRHAHEQRHLRGVPARRDGHRQRPGGHQAIRARRSPDRGRPVERQVPHLADPGPVQRRELPLEGAVPPAGESGSHPREDPRAVRPQSSQPGTPANRENSTWAVFYSFDQYFWQPAGDPKHGIGMFFNFGASDGDANPVKYSYATGIGGNGAGPGAQGRQLRDRLGPHSVQQTISFPFCVSGSTSASTRRTRSRCSTTPRSRSGCG